MINKKEQLTVKGILSMLECCSRDALIDLIVNIGDNTLQVPVVSMLVHETEDKKELISFLSEKEDNDYDLQI